jgi:hypothetical protein
MIVAGFEFTNDLVPLLPQGLAGLRARIVELARLADDDRSRADDEDAVDVLTAGHGEIRFMVRRARPGGGTEGALRSGVYVL